LKPRGVLFSSNPRGNNEEGLSDDRYACFFDLDTWRDYVTSAGFAEVGHYRDSRGISSRRTGPCPLVDTESLGGIAVILLHRSGAQRCATD
jgi:hypothetical protein